MTLAHVQYAFVRHPQYIGFVLVMFGFLLQWPTVLTLTMFPALVAMYAHFAREEERETLKHSVTTIAVTWCGRRDTFRASPLSSEREQ